MNKHEAKMLLNFATDHERTTCSDEQVSNWYTTAGRGGTPRCTRCALLKAAQDAEYAENLRLDQISVHMLEQQP